LPFERRRGLPLLQLRGVRKSFGAPRSCLDGIDLERSERGDVITLIGCVGLGERSTLLR
jgi:ABC-type histidine transport system ATPase subunit